MTGASAEGRMLEGIASLNPFRVFRTVKWSECDPAGVVFAPHFYCYALGALDAMVLHLLDGVRGEVQSPVKSATLTHYSTLKPGDVLHLEVAPVHIGRTSFDMRVEGMSDDRAIFNAAVRIVCTDQAVTRSVPVPERLKGRLLERLAIPDRKENREEE